MSCFSSSRNVIIKRIKSNVPSPVAEFWTGRDMRYCSRSGGGLIGAGRAAGSVVGMSAGRDRLIIPSVAELNAPANGIVV